MIGYAAATGVGFFVGNPGGPLGEDNWPEFGGAFVTGGLQQEDLVRSQVRGIRFLLGVESDWESHFLGLQTGLLSVFCSKLELKR